MMDKSKAEQVANANIGRIASELQLNGWRLEVSFVPLGADNYGSCTPDPRSCRAEIEIDPAAHDDEAGLLKTLRHELLHILNADFETYRKAVRQFVSEDAFNALDQFFEHASETLVMRLERILDAEPLTAAEP